MNVQIGIIRYHTITDGMKYIIKRRIQAQTRLLVQNKLWNSVMSLIMYFIPSVMV